MHLIDRLVAFISPATALKMMGARQAIRAYEAARPSRTHKATREHRSGNAALNMAGRSLREQARWLDENHDIVIGLFDKLEERIVGANGIQVEPQPRDAAGQVMPELAAELRRRWAAWSLRPEVTGMFTRPQMERLVVRSWLRDGDVFGQMVKGRVANYQHLTDTPFAIELLESDFIPYELDDTSKKIRQGIEVNDWGRPRAFHVLYDHPGEPTGIRFKTKRIDADRMLHLALRRRLHQLRGVSLLHGVITRLADLKDVEEAERVAARISAALAFYIKKQGDYLPERDGEQQAPREIPIAPGMTFDQLRVGEEVGTIQSNRPNTQLNIWRQGQLKSASAGTRSNYSSIARDYDGSYSAQRQELVEGFEGFAVLQDEFVAQWARPVYRNWLAMEVINGLALPPDLDRASLFDAVYMGPVMPWIDPQKESEGWKTQIRGGAATETEWIRARGRNPDEVRRQRINEVEFNRKHGLVTDSDPANDTHNPQGGNDATSTSTRDAEDTGRKRNRTKQPADG